MKNQKQKKLDFIEYFEDNFLRDFKKDFFQEFSKITRKIIIWK